MGYLYLNFLENFESGSRSRNDFYTTSLKEQYEALKSKLGYVASDTLQEFVARIFPVKDKSYYISLPCFDRRIKTRTDKRGRDHQYMSNIVIRPEKDLISSSALPNNYDVIIIGDVQFEKVINVTVKGIELIDVNVLKFGERNVYCMAACAFAETTISDKMDREIIVPDYGVREMHDAVLTNDFVNSLCTDLFPVPNPQETMWIFDEWQKYVKFRRYYLGKQSERCEPYNNVVVCDSFMITKDIYRGNEDRYSKVLLDDIPDFAKGEQIILSEEVRGSDSFPLIRIDIEKNRKEVLSDTLGRNSRKSKYETWLRRYTKDSMGLSSTPPKYDDKGDIPKGTYFYQYSLGERYLFAYMDIEPDCKAIEKKYEDEKKKEFSLVDDKYAGIINDELERYITAESQNLRDVYVKKLEAYRQYLAETIEKDLAENNDEEIKKKIEAEIKRRTNVIESELKNQLKVLDEERKNVKKANFSEDEEKERYNEIRDREDALRKEAGLKKNAVRRTVEIRPFYVARNERRLESKKEYLSNALKDEIETKKSERESQLKLQYKGQVDSEKKAIKEEKEKKAREEKVIKVEDETIRRYQIYFRPADIIDKITVLQKAVESFKTGYLTYDNRAEKAKIERQEKALNSILGGYVKNPYLPAYLFAPKTLGQAPHIVQEDPEWCLESLNDRQKLAVRRALASESLFLLQGPPGTGKTQVIAEITAQYTKQGKKVLISSETHKAIDNVFERLPKIPEIRPLRLIPSQNGKETNYSPEKLVDNFYANISGNLEKQIGRFEHFEETKATFDEEMRELRRSYDRLLSLKAEYAKYEVERSKISQEINKLNGDLQVLRGQLSLVYDDIDEYRRTMKTIDSIRFTTEGVKKKYIEKFASKTKDIISSFTCFVDVPLDKAADLFRADIKTIKQELSLVLSEDSLIKLEQERNRLNGEIFKLLDPETFFPPEKGDEHYLEFKSLQTELISVKGKIDKIKKAQNSSSFDLSDSLIYSLVPLISANKKLLQELPEQLMAFDIRMQTLISEIKNEIESDMSEVRSQESDITGKINTKQRDINEKKQRYEELSENDCIEEYGALNSALKQKITRFFRDFDIVSEYNTLDEAFDIIKAEWDKLELNYKSTRKENQVKIPMYRAICKYLSQPDILEEDRQAYTNDLYNCANVFGITCTSRDKFTKYQLEELGRYGIESVDIRTQGIDVVIIDEVSKSSFLDLLIPILYGKTVILVGDHRQLPPMYDLRNLRENDFEGLNDTIINKQINDEYTALYEECFFKTLYEQVPDDFRVMLNKQYRCHSHIMEVFNHFYGGSQKGLTIGKQNQDDEKEHNLTVRITGNTIIDPQHHIYFVDCDQKESSAYEGSTSKINEQEAEVAIALLRELDKASSEMLRTGKIKVNPDKKIDERPSAGIICTYGDQAGLIKKKRKYQQFNGFSQKPDEKLIISTVDDFQGDERDIIIVSMVRNPALGRRFDVEFIKKFERINVALSRARKMLIIVGSKKFLSDYGIIDLPDMEGRKELDKNNYPVFREIIDTISFRGRVLTASDIIGG